MIRKRKNDGKFSLPFRYTDDSARIDLIEEIYPISNLLIKSISNIPWEDYEFIGPTQCTIQDDEESDYFVENTGKFENIFNFNVVSRLCKYPYYIFGGAACELYGKKYSKIKKIHDIVDPSADIDVRILSPSVFIEDNLDFNTTNEIDIITDYINILTVYDKNKVSNLTEHYTKWIFDEVVKIIRKFSYEFNTSVCSLPNLEDDEETSIANLSESIGPILVTRSYLFSDNTIKIQVSTKINNVSQHFIEFVLIISEENFKSQNSNRTIYQIIDNVYVQDLHYLIENQYEAFISRFEHIKTSPYLYKIYNHCARILHLLKIYKYLKENNKLSDVQKIFVKSSQFSKNLYTFYKLLETKIRKTYCSKFTEEIKEILEFLFPNSIVALKNKLQIENKTQHKKNSVSVFETIKRKSTTIRRRSRSRSRSRSN